MPKTLEIIIGDVKKVSEEIARRTIAERTIAEIEQVRASDDELKSLEDSKKDAQEHLDKLKGMDCHEFDREYGKYDWDGASDDFLIAKRNMKIERAKKNLEWIREEIKKITRPYVMACAKGSSAVEYYKALGQANITFEGVTAFCIDQDLGTSNGVDFAVKNLPPNILIDGINAKFYQDGQLVDSNVFQQILKTTPVCYGLTGREIYPRCLSGLPVEIGEACQSYEERIKAKGGIDIAIIGLGVDPMHIGSNFPPTYSDSRTHLAEKIDKDGNLIGYAMTMGIATLRSAKKVVLFAAGEKKADGVRELLECNINENCPPSYLRNMNNLIVALDQDAASRLDFDKLKEIYKDRELILKC